MKALTTADDKNLYLKIKNHQIGNQPNWEEPTFKRKLKTVQFRETTQICDIQGKTKSGILNKEPKVLKNRTLRVNFLDLDFSLREISML